MTRKKLAFTLPELLIVLAIITILAGLLFPVFRMARASAKRTACLSNFKQLHVATSLYVADWDDRMMPVNPQPAAPANSSNDRTWVQLTLPYARSFSIFNCPSDYGSRPSTESSFDQDLVPGDAYSKYYSASLRVNSGYNFVYLAPVYQAASGAWISDPKSGSALSEPSKTLLFVDTVWGRTENGTPFGGGSWLVVPPCRFTIENGIKRDTFSVAPGAEVFAPSEGWTNDQDSPFVYGSAWPWHDGRVNLIRLDGSASSIPAGSLSAGCDVQEKWQGVIRDPDKYIWSIF